jgi:transposase
MRAATSRALPNNVAALRSLVIDLQARLQSRDDTLQAREAQLQAGQQELVYLRTWIERLKLELARLRRMQFGRSSEQLSARIEQLELIVEEFEASAAQKTMTAPRTPARKPCASRCLRTCRARRWFTPPQTLVRIAAPRCSASARMSPRCWSMCRHGSR